MATGMSGLGSPIVYSGLKYDFVYGHNYCLPWSPTRDPEGDESEAAYEQRVAETAERIGRGEEFADLAAELSDDLGSASLGGELGFTDGSAFPDEMETAIAVLTEPGDISGAVETDAGTHFIRLEERIAGDVVDYASVREDLRASIEAAEAERNLLIAVEELRDLAFNAPDLSGPAAAIGTGDSP